MTSSLRVLFLLCLATLFAGCAAKGPLFSGFQPVPEGQAEVVVYRPDLFRAGGETINVAFDRRAIGSLKNAGWLRISTVPGEHALELDEGLLSVRKAVQTQVTLGSRERRVFRVLPGGMSGAVPLPTGPILIFGPWTVREVKEQEVTAEFTGLRYSE
jgi:hypothetical protein